MIRRRRGRPLTAALATALILASGCHDAPMVTDRNHDGVTVVYCLGDSNTDAGRLQTPKWCEMVAKKLPSWKFINGGFARAKAMGDCFLCGQPLLTSALAANHIDMVLISLGTNDMNQQPSAVVDTLLALREQATQANAEVLIATIPPRFTEDHTLVENIAATNDLLARRMPPNRLIDFFNGMVASDYFPDGVHINDAGQEKRADAALRALRALHAVPADVQ